MIRKMLKITLIRWLKRNALKTEKIDEIDCKGPSGVTFLEHQRNHLIGKKLGI